MEVKASLTGTFDEAQLACLHELSSWTSAIGAVLADAVAGDRLAARRYAHSYVELANYLADRLAQDESSRLWLPRVVRREAYSLPFRACLANDDIGSSLALTVLTDIRRMLPSVADLEWPGACTTLVASRFEFDDRGLFEFERVVDEVVDAERPPLEQILSTFDLSLTDAGRLFGVSRQALSQWLEDRVPSDRQAKVVTVAEVATLLEHSLVKSRIPGISRKSAQRYNGRSMLKMIEDDEHEALLAITRSSFDWTVTA